MEGEKQANPNDKKEELIEEILNLQQELDALENRSQSLQHENGFFRSQIE